MLRNQFNLPKDFVCMDEIRLSTSKPATLHNLTKMALPNQAAGPSGSVLWPDGTLGCAIAPQGLSVTHCYSTLFYV